MVRRRRRYEVVVEGLTGPAAAQRSVISEHRSRDDALEAAADERARLEVIHGESAADWRIVVLHDGKVIAEERPAATPGEAPVPPPEPEPEGEEAPPEPAAREPWPDLDVSGPVPEWVISRVEESIERRREKERGESQPTEGTRGT